MKKTSLKPKDLLKQLQDVAVRARPYAVPAFLLLVAGIYGSLLLRAHNLSSAPPSNAAVINQTGKTRAPKIDPIVLQQLQSLQDNSVSVQSLFEQARTNPFQTTPEN